MNQTKSFDPLAWANNSANNVSDNGDAKMTAPHVNNGHADGGSTLDVELAKARATADELLRMGANIAESYDDYLQLGFALANGLGEQGRDIYHELCAQSVKYKEADCEKKWQECLSKNDGRTTIASFYKMAQDAGVDLSAIGRAFPSISSNPHGSSENVDGTDRDVSEKHHLINNKGVIFSGSPVPPAEQKPQDSSEGMRVLRNSQPSKATETADDDEAGLLFSETFSDRMDEAQQCSLIRDVMGTQNDAESKDKVVLAALIAWSGAIPNVKGLYHSDMVEPPLYAILNAPSGVANKGAVKACLQLLMPVEWEIAAQVRKEQEVYESQHNAWLAMDPKQRKNTPEPKEPKSRSLFIAGNSSASVVYEDLLANGGSGIIFESEADTVAAVLTQEWGQWSDLLRKAFHHERLTLRRKNDNLRVVIEHPRLAALLTCTPGQIPLLLPSNQEENGLANRFLFYCLRGSAGWKNPFGNDNKPLAEDMLKIGQRFLKLYHALQQRADKPLEFAFSDAQKQLFNEFFRPLYDEQIGMNGRELSAYVFRLGLSTFRLAMVLTVLRCADNEPMFEPLSQVLVCTDQDFQTALTIANTLIDHTCHVYNNVLVHDQKPVVAPGVKMPDRQRQFLTSLPNDFTAEIWKEAALQLNIPPKTAERYMGEFVNKFHLVKRIQNGVFRK